MNKSSDVSNSDFKILFIMSLGPEKNGEILFTCVVLVIHLIGTIHPHVMQIIIKD